MKSRSSKRLALQVVGLLVLSLLGVPVSAASADPAGDVAATSCADAQVDDRAPGDDYYNATYGSFYAARSFTATWSTITEVGTWMHTASDQPLTFTLIEGTGINGAVVASVTADAPGGVGKVVAAFPTPVEVERGETYILKINSPTATTGIVWNGDPTGSTGYYNGGSPGTTTTTAPATHLTFCDELTEADFPPISADFNAVHGGGIAGQSFVALDGSLGEASIWLNEANDGPLSVSVRVDDLAGAVIGSATLPTGAAGERTVTFTPQVGLTEGSTYVLAVTAAQLENLTGVVAQQTANPSFQGYTEAGEVATDMAMRLRFGPPQPPGPIGVESCPAGPALDPTYVASVEQALTANTDIWGDAAIADADGPSYSNVNGRLNPLRHVGSPAGHSGNQLTDSGVYYLPFGVPGESFAGERALHVADGSQIISTTATGRKATIFVGTGSRERFGLCEANLGEPALEGGYQPVLGVAYTDLAGTTYTHESFAALIPGTATLASYLEITASGAGAAELGVQFSEAGLSAGDGVVVNSSGTVAFFSEGGEFAGNKLTFDLELQPGTPQTIHIVRPVSPTSAMADTPSSSGHSLARETVTSAWDSKLAEGMVFSVPEARVMDAQRNLLIQNLALQWRYSVGNAYEGYYLPESSSALLTLGNYGHEGVTRAGAQFLLSGAERSYPAWSRGMKLQLGAQYFDLTKDADFIDDNVAAYEDILEVMAADRATDVNGLMPKETEGGDIPDLIYGTHSQASAWRGMVDIVRVLRETGHTDLADQYAPEADAFGVALREAIAESAVYTASDEVFIPWDLLSGDEPYDKATESHVASYWNLLNPYVLASGILSETQLAHAWNYAARHGSTIMGLQRFNYYPTPIGSATAGGLPGYLTDGDDSVYAVSRVKALASLDEPDHLALTLYGKLTAGMTPNTFISGEGHTIDPADGKYYRSMYLPPDVANNDLFLVTLRESLVNVTYDSGSLAPAGLRLANSTPRGWLEDGKEITVDGAATPFGAVSFAISSSVASGQIEVEATVPSSDALESVELRLRLPGGHSITSAQLADLTPVPLSGETLDLTGLSGTFTVLVEVDGSQQDGGEPEEDGAIAPPAKGVLHTDNGWGTGLKDGDYNVVFNMWWGENGNQYRLYENGNIISEQAIDAGSPQHQQVSVPVAGRVNGSYIYTAELKNSKGTTATAPITVLVSDANPGTPVLSHDNWDDDGTFLVNANLWWGTGATEYTFYENGNLVASGALSSATPNPQVAVLPVTDRTPGTYVYAVEFANSAGATTSSPLEVIVVR